MTLLVVLGSMMITLSLGAAVKAPCASGDWTDGRQYRQLCYSDIVPLLGTEQLTGGRLPYIEPCDQPPGSTFRCDEYPVLTMYFMRAAAWISGAGTAQYFWVTAVMLTICAVGVATSLYRLAGGRALWFALAPTLLLAGFVNWDLFAVALAAGAIVAFAQHRDGWAGALLGLGAAAKLYPALLAVPLVAHRLRGRQPDAAIRIGWAGAGTWLAVNLPFAIASPSEWSEFFRFNAERPPDFDSLWYIGCRHVQVGTLCDGTGAVNVLAFVAFLASFAVVWAAKARRDPDFPRWSLGLPLLICFLVTNKVYSPQYGLWLLPWFALAGPSFRTFAAFETADLAVFVTRFSFLGRYSGFAGLPFGAFETAVLVRAVVLVWCLVAWVRTPVEEQVGMALHGRPVARVPNARFGRG
jgi:uncharacterized membrane protein